MEELCKEHIFSSAVCGGFSENRIHFPKHPEFIFCFFPAISFWLSQEKISAGIYFMLSKACGQGL
jgi:hypothetical protein